MIRQRYYLFFLWSFSIRADKQILTNQPNIVVIDKNKMSAPVIDIKILSDRNVKMKRYEKLDKYFRVKLKMWKVKATVPVIIRARATLVVN